MTLMLMEEMKREEIMWKQKSRNIQPTIMDLNTKFFHLSTIIKRRRNFINTIKMANGKWCFEREDIGNNFIEHFQHIFTSSNPDKPCILSNLLNPTINDKDNQWLCAIPDEKEIMDNVNHIGSMKAPGPDGVNAKMMCVEWW